MTFLETNNSITDTCYQHAAWFQVYRLDTHHHVPPNYWSSMKMKFPLTAYTWIFTSETSDKII